MTKIKDDPRVYRKAAEEPKRARNEKGQLVADDPSTPDVNEAWEGGKAPKAPKKKAATRGKKSSSKS
jgi:hypothetical protein